MLVKLGDESLPELIVVAHAMFGGDKTFLVKIYWWLTSIWILVVKMIFDTTRMLNFMRNLILHERKFKVYKWIEICKRWVQIIGLEDILWDVHFLLWLLSLIVGVKGIVYSSEISSFGFCTDKRLGQLGSWAHNPSGPILVKMVGLYVLFLLQILSAT